MDGMIVAGGSGGPGMGGVDRTTMLQGPSVRASPRTTSEKDDFGRMLRRLDVAFVGTDAPAVTSASVVDQETASLDGSDDPLNDAFLPPIHPSQGPDPMPSNTSEEILAPFETDPGDIIRDEAAPEFAEGSVPALLGTLPSAWVSPSNATVVPQAAWGPVHAAPLRVAMDGSGPVTAGLLPVNLLIPVAIVGPSDTNSSEMVTAAGPLTLLQRTDTTSPDGLSATGLPEEAPITPGRAASLTGITTPTGTATLDRLGVTPSAGVGATSEVRVEPPAAQGSAIPDAQTLVRPNSAVPALGVTPSRSNVAVRPMSEVSAGHEAVRSDGPDLSTRDGGSSTLIESGPKLSGAGQGGYDHGSAQGGTDGSRYRGLAEEAVDKARPPERFLAALSSKDRENAAPMSALIPIAGTNAALPLAVVTPVQAALLMRQIATHPVLRTAGTALVVDPVGLGALRLSVERSERGLRLVIDAARPETADLMRRHVDQLLLDLRLEGFGDVEVSIGDDDASGGDGRSGARSGPQPDGLSGRRDGSQGGDASADRTPGGDRQETGAAGSFGRLGGPFPAADALVRASGHLDLRL